jgi:hypothetical protein
LRFSNYRRDIRAHSEHLVEFARTIRNLAGLSGTHSVLLLFLAVVALAASVLCLIVCCQATTEWIAETRRRRAKRRAYAQAHREVQGPAPP